MLCKCVSLMQNRMPKRYAITANPEPWPQWLIDIINKFHRKPETIFCTLFHFSLHDFHLNSIIHNKWPRALLLPSPIARQATHYTPPLARAPPNIPNRFASMKQSFVHIILWSSVVVCWDSEKWLHVNYIQPKNVIGHWAWHFSRYILHRSKQWQKQCILCNWNRLLLLLFCSGFFAHVTRANDCVYNENAGQTAQQYFKHTTHPEWWKTFPPFERKHKLLLIIIYPACTERRPLHAALERREKYSGMEKSHSRNSKPDE